MTDGSGAEVRFGTIALENTTPVVMLVYVTPPDGDEHFVTTLKPGDTTVQFTPLGATWRLLPEVPEFRFVSKSVRDYYAIAASSFQEADALVGRGGIARDTIAPPT